MKNKHTKKKINLTVPNWLALILIIFGLIGGVLLINKVAKLSPKAANSVFPEQVRITNVNDMGFTVSWITQLPVKGFIFFGDNQQLNQKAYDERDGATVTGENLAHYVTFKNLKPSTKYYLKINSAGNSYDNNGKPYEVTTGPTINLPLPESDNAYGVVLTPTNQPANGVIVYLTMANTTPLSSLTKENGTWMIPLSMARSMTLNSYANYDRKIQIQEIFVQAGNLGTTSAINTTKNDSPVPSLILGKTYDFSQTNETAKTFSPAEQPATGSGNLTPTATKTTSQGFDLSPLDQSTSSGKLDITNPTEDESVNTSLPEFKGTAPVKGLVEIVVQSENQYSGITIADDQGGWQWTPPAVLAPGKHTVTASFKDANGIIQKVTREFTVMAADQSDLPAYTATPSGQLTQIPPTPTTIIIVTPTATPTPPKPGNLTMTLGFLIIGVVLFFVGLVQLKVF